MQKLFKFTTGDAVLPEASISDGGNITPTVAGVLLGNKMPSASVDTGDISNYTHLMDPCSKDRTIQLNWLYVNTLTKLYS